VVRARCGSKELVFGCFLFVWKVPSLMLLVDRAVDSVARVFGRLLAADCADVAALRLVGSELRTVQGDDVSGCH